MGEGWRTQKESNL